MNEQQELQADEKVNSYTFKSGNTTVHVTEYFTGELTYLDIIKAALRREFSDK